MPLYLIRHRTLGHVLGTVYAQTPEDAITREAEEGVHPAEDMEAVVDTIARAKLSDLVEHGGLSNREFARRVLGRDVRSLARYLGGETIPPELAEQIERMSINADERSVTLTIARGDAAHEKLRLFRWSAGLSDQELAYLLEQDVNQISEWIEGWGDIPPAITAKIDRLTRPTR